MNAMSHQKRIEMRKLILAGSHAQYRDWLVLHKANPRAAVEINRETDLMGHDPDVDELVLTGTYHDNPAYMSNHYLYLVNGRRMALAS